ncbi:uncharacterized protein [Ptychodera flava]|uniref:uncharacterized protein isoform X1 n=1 Tax=Ptychodera flava TaxID=63121 RepID=UPI00396A72E8
MFMKYSVSLITVLVLGVCRAAEWRTTPTDGQYEVGSEVILSCELDNLNINLPPSWALLTEGAATATTITDGTNIATEFNDLVELVGDQNNGEWNLKIKSISFDQQGEYIMHFTSIRSTETVCHYWSLGPCEVCSTDWWRG